MSARKSVSLSLRYFARLWTDHHSKSLRVRVDTGCLFQPPCCISAKQSVVCLDQPSPFKD